MSAASFTVRVIGPTWERLHAAAGRMDRDAAVRGLEAEDPASGRRLADRAAAVGADVPAGPRPAADGRRRRRPQEPPGVRSRFHGLRVAPNSRLSVTPTQPNVGVFVLPSMMPPAAFSRATEGASSVGTLSR